MDTVEVKRDDSLAAANGPTDTKDDHAAESASSLTDASVYVPPVCRFFLSGICRFGPHCRYSHVSDTLTEPTAANATLAVPKPASQGIRAEAPPFVPSGNMATTCGAQPVYNSLSYAQVASAVGGTVTAAGVIVNEKTVCPYEGPCQLGPACTYEIHLEVCGMCDKYCLNPGDEQQRRTHKQNCLRQHEINMELSFAVARSKDKKCGICFDTVVEKTGHEKRFGILPNCNHTYCLECIRKWRKAPQFEHKITRSCPECRICSDFVCPSAFWVDTKEQKDKLLNDYRAALNAKDCKYFRRGAGRCPFGNKCFYKHANRSGELVDVGNPKSRPRRLRRSSDEVMDLLDLLLWDFVDQRDHQWMSLFDDSDFDSDEDSWFDE